MLRVNKDIQIYVTLNPTDMRRSIDGLSMLVVEEFKSEPQSGHLYVFFNRQGDKVKILYWNKNGFVLHYKRMEKGRFFVPKRVDKLQLVITEVQLQGLLAGLNFEIMGDFDEIEYDKIF